MQATSLSALILTAFFSSLTFFTRAQFPFGLVDQRQHTYCQGCKQLLEEKPKEVLFGLNIDRDGSIYFSMTDINWFQKIFKNNSYGVTVDIVSKTRYACSTGIDSRSARPGSALPLGTVLEPIYRKALLDENLATDGSITVKIGKLPAALKGQELESNLVIVNGNFICYYSNFVNITRNSWQLLPMGLFTDSLIRDTKNNGSTQTDFFTYTKKEQLTVPFEKSSAAFNAAYFKRCFDSIHLSDYQIQQLEIRAYSSVEGREITNKILVQKRADTIVKVLKQYQPLLKRISINTAENWLEYFTDIEKSNIEELKGLSKTETRRKLTLPSLAANVEPLLSHHRKAVITFYLKGKSSVSFSNEEQMLNAFKKAVIQKNIPEARTIQKEIVDEIAGNRLPADYINQLEVPQSKEFSSLLNDREVYRYLLKATSEYEAYQNFVTLQKLDPSNGHVRYNVCALSFFMWQYGGDTSMAGTLLQQINALQQYGINHVLIKRMQINYHILAGEEYMERFQYDKKDSCVDFIYNVYQNLRLDDDDIYSLAKYFAYYSRLDYAEEIVTPRIDQLDVSEDLLFFYINTQFYTPASFESEPFGKAMLNAVSLNPKRYCNFFLPNDRGGASMQLLEYQELRKIYCETCK